MIRIIPFLALLIFGQDTTESKLIRFLHRGPNDVPIYDITIALKYYMKRFATLLLLAATTPALAQTDLFPDALEDFLLESNRLRAYSDVAIEWSMDGQTQAQLNEGLNNLLEEHPVNAESNFAQVIRQKPEQWQAYYYRAVSRKQQNKLNEARADLLHVLVAHGPFYEGFVEMAKVERLALNIGAVQKYLDKAIQLAPERAMALFLKAELDWQLGKVKPALDGYALCVQRDSLFHDVRMRLGLFQVTSGDNMDRAMPQLNKVLAMDSTHRYARLFRSLAGFKTDPSQALIDLNVLARRWPGNRMVLYLHGLILAKNGDYQRAFPELRKLIELAYQDENAFRGQQTWLDKMIDVQNAGAYTVSRVYGLSDYDAGQVKQAYCLIVAGDYGHSIVAINRANVAYKDPLCIFLKAVASEHMGDHQGAFRLYSQALTLDPDIVDAHKKRGIYEQELEHWDKSIADFNDMLRINSHAYVAFKLRGISNYYINQFAKAVDDFSHYLQQDSLDKETMGYRGMTYLKVGKRLDAAADFANADHANLLNFKTLAVSLDSLLASQDTTKALAYADRLTRNTPFFTEAYVIKMKILLAKKKWGDLRSEIDRAISNSRTDAGDQKHAYLLGIRAITWVHEQKYYEALAKFNEALLLDANNTLFFLERGKLYLALDKKSKAVSDLKKASSLGSKEAHDLLQTL
jgi:tetratricopeptide (TPR) repeat protein